MLEEEVEQKKKEIKTKEAELMASLKNPSSSK